jgi:hypothetical protein
VEETEDNGQDKEDERSQDEEDSEAISHRQSLADAKEWFARLDSAGPSDFMAEGRDQPITPSRNILD